MIPFRRRDPVGKEENHRNEAVGGSLVAVLEVNQSERKRKIHIVEVIHEKSQKNLQNEHLTVGGNE